MDFSAIIELRKNTNEWGPYSIDLSGGIPEGNTIAGVTIKAYTGKVLPAQALAGLTNIATEIIEDDSDSVSGSQVFWRMQYPADSALHGTKATLIFEITTSGGGTHSFYLYFVRIV